MNQLIKVPFVWNEPKPPVIVPGRLVFRPLTEQTEDDFRSALELSLAASLDRLDRALYDELGAEELARHTMRVGDQFHYEKSWWQVAYTRGGALVGFLQPVVFRGCQRGHKEEGTIYHYGVVPAQRGNRYGQDLLRKLTATLQDVGIWRIFCDADEQNIPSLRALSETGFEIMTDDPEFRDQGPWRSKIRSAADIPNYRSVVETTY